MVPNRKCKVCGAELDEHHVNFCSNKCYLEYRANGTFNKSNWERARKDSYVTKGLNSRGVDSTEFRHCELCQTRLKCTQQCFCSLECKTKATKIIRESNTYGDDLSE